MGIFMLIWGGLIIGSADNIIKPYLISQGANISFLSIFIGVLGGALAFGVIGIFIGPVVMAVVLTLLHELLDNYITDEQKNEIEL